MAQLDLLGRLQWPTRSSAWPASGPGQHLLLQPDRTCAKSCDRLWKVWSLHITGRGPLADAKYVGNLGQSDELKRHQENGKRSTGSLAVVYEVDRLMSIK
jgi:hypothetical protein